MRKCKRPARGFVVAEGEVPLLGPLQGERAGEAEEGGVWGKQALLTAWTPSWEEEGNLEKSSFVDTSEGVCARTCKQSQ